MGADRDYRLHEGQGMRLIDDAGQLWHRLWSVRLSLLAAALSALAAGLAMFQTTNLLVVILAIVVNLAAGLARLIPQPKAYENDKSCNQ